MTQAALETVRVIFSSQGNELANETSFAQLIIGSAKSTIFSVLGTAEQLCHCAKRHTLTVNDINNALECLEMEPLFGYKSDEEPHLTEVNIQGPLKLLAYDDYYTPPEQYARKEFPPIPLETHHDIAWISVNGAVHENTEVADVMIEKPDPAQIKSANPQRQNAQDSDAFIVSNKHQFSFTHQKFFRESRIQLLSGNTKQTEWMFYLLSSLDCIQTLVPYYVRFSLVQFRDHPNDWNTLKSALCTARALIQNTQLKYINCYLQNFITIALSFLLNPSMLKKNSLEFIRMVDMAAEFLLVICDKVQSNYPMVEPNITNELLSVLLSRESSIKEKYGAFAGVSAFGPEAIAQFVLPNVSDIINDLFQGAMRSGDRDDRLIGQMLYDNIVNSVGLCLHSDTARRYSLGTLKMSPKTFDERERIIDVFGSQLLPFYIDESVELYV